jgi:hypothetical protein
MAIVCLSSSMYLIYQDFSAQVHSATRPKQLQIARKHCKLGSIVRQFVANRRFIFIEYLANIRRHGAKSAPGTTTEPTALSPAVHQRSGGLHTLGNLAPSALQLAGPFHAHGTSLTALRLCHRSPPAVTSGGGPRCMQIRRLGPAALRFGGAISAPQTQRDGTEA